MYYAQLRWISISWDLNVCGKRTHIHFHSSDKIVTEKAIHRVLKVCEKAITSSVYQRADKIIAPAHSVWTIALVTWSQPRDHRMLEDKDGMFAGKIKWRWQFAVRSQVYRKDEDEATGERLGEQTDKVSCVCIIYSVSVLPTTRLRLRGHVVCRDRWRHHVNRPRQ